MIRFLPIHIAISMLMIFIISVYANANNSSNISRDSEYLDTVIDISNIYIPHSFDAESDAFVIASGMYPNGCYRWKEAKVESVNPFQHTITSYAQVSQGMCIMVLIPFMQEIRLGKMEPGTHVLRFLAGDGTYLEKEITVE